MDLKKLLYKILVKYYLSDSINTPLKDFALGFKMLGPAMIFDSWDGGGVLGIKMTITTSCWLLQFNIEDSADSYPDDQCTYYT